MKQGILIYAVLLIVVFGIFTVNVLAKSESTVSVDDLLPDKNGTYDVPEKVNLKLRVFVHEPKSISQQSVPASCDGDSDTVDGLTGWKLPATVIYTLNTKTLPTSLSSADFKQIAVNAFSRWQKAVNNSVSFTEDSNTASISKKALDGKNVIAWGNIPGKTFSITYIWYNTQLKQVVETDTIFNSNLPWTWSDPSLNQCSSNLSSYDVQNILTHETGHWMGLDDEMSSNNTMYAYSTKGEIKKDTLSTGDVTAITNLYK